MINCVIQTYGLTRRFGSLMAEGLIKPEAGEISIFNRQDPRPLHAGTTYEFTHVHVTGSAALAIVEIFQEDQHIYTDYIVLYKFADGWKIVTKIYYQYPGDDSGQ